MFSRVILASGSVVDCPLRKIVKLTKSLTPLPGLGRGWGRVRTPLLAKNFLSNQVQSSFRSCNQSVPRTL